MVSDSAVNLVAHDRKYLGDHCQVHLLGKTLWELQLEIGPLWLRRFKQSIFIALKECHNLSDD